MEIICRTCNTPKNSSEYYLSKQNANGFWVHCKECTKIKKDKKKMNFQIYKAINNVYWCVNHEYPVTSIQVPATYSIPDLKLILKFVAYKGAFTIKEDRIYYMVDYIYIEETQKATQAKKILVTGIKMFDAMIDIVNLRSEGKTDKEIYHLLKK